MLGADSAFASSSEPNSASRSLQHYVEVHSENAGKRIILNAQVDVLLDTEAEAASVGEVSLLKLTILDFEASF